MDITKTFVYLCTNTFVLRDILMANPTDSELEILNVLWQCGPSTVRFVNEQLNKEKDTGYTTTLKIMQIMKEKGLVKRNEEARSHVYHPEVVKKDTQKKLINKLLSSAFEGSASKMIMETLGNHTTSKEELEKIKELIDELETKQS